MSLCIWRVGRVMCVFWRRDGVEPGLVQEPREEWAGISSATRVLQLKADLCLACSVPDQGQSSPLERWCDRNQ